MKCGKRLPFPKKNLVPLGLVYLFDITCKVLLNTAGPQKNTPTSVSGCRSEIYTGDGKDDSQCVEEMSSTYATEHTIPVRSAEVRWGTQTSDSISVCADVLHQDVVHVVLLDLRSQVDRDLNGVVRVLFLDGLEEGVEPFGGAEVSNDPSEVDLRQPGALGLVVKVVKTIPNYKRGPR